MATSANGVYVELHPKGNMTVTIKLLKKTIGPIETSVAKEVLALADYNFTDLNKITAWCRRHRFREDAPPLNIDAKKHDDQNETLKDVFDRVIQSLSKTNPIMAALISLTVRNQVPKNDGSAKWRFQRDYTIIGCTREALDLHFAIFKLMNKLNMDTQNETLSSTYQVEQQYNPKQKQTIYIFRSISDYYNFLMMQFALLQPNLLFCHYCGKPFIPKTRKATKYCDRPQWNGKTCKQVAPVAMHKNIAESDAVIKAFDTTKQKLYRRYERTRDCVYEDKMLYYEDYCEWNEKATAARDAYLRGELSAEDALAVIKSMD